MIITIDAEKQLTKSNTPHDKNTKQTRNRREHPQFEKKKKVSMKNPQLT